MPDDDGREARGESSGLEPAGGAAAQPESIDYLSREVNLLRPSTPFMRDHLKVIWTGFVAWALIVFGPVTLTLVAPGAMTTRMPVIGFPLHYFMAAIGAPSGALILAVLYARKRDQLDQKYGIEPAAPKEAGGGSEEAAAADGGVAE